MEKFFKLSERNTTVSKELIGGITTFLAMAYILAVNPSILSGAGMSWGAVFTATALSAAIATLVMAFCANLPVALAPGLGLNAFFTYTVVLGMGCSFQLALTAVLLEGVLFIILSLCGIREAIIKSIPEGLKKAVAVGIGLFIAIIGLANAGIVSTETGTLIGFVNFTMANKAAIVAVVSGLGDIWNVSEKASQTPWVVDGKLNIDPQREAYIEMAKKLIDGGYTNDTTAWQPAWNADMRGEGDKKVFAYFGPAWLINYVMAGQCEGTDAYGDWRVCTPPVGFWWGGSWLLANKAAIEDADKKEVIGKIVEWITLDATENGLLYAWANGTISAAKDTVSSGVVMKMSDGSMDILGGQNPFEIFVTATSYASAKCKCEYDSTLNGAWQDQVKQYAMGEKDKDAALNEFKDVAANAGITVE